MTETFSSGKVHGKSPANTLTPASVRWHRPAQTLHLNRGIFSGCSQYGPQAGPLRGTSSTLTNTGPVLPVTASLLCFNNYTFHGFKVPGHSRKHMYPNYLRGGQKPIGNESPRQPEAGPAGREQETILRVVTQPVPRARHCSRLRRIWRSRKGHCCHATSSQDNCEALENEAGG